ncbi:MAG: hypothetical protein MJY92_07770, partial [Bacteroidales bacterium]|nr:hypothetical protein [Bacteroidales bacterium]
MTFTCDGDIYFYYDITTTPEDQEAFAKHSMYLIDSMACGFESCSLEIRDATPEQWQETSALIVDYLIYQPPLPSQSLPLPLPIVPAQPNEKADSTPLWQRMLSFSNSTTCVSGDRYILFSSVIFFRFCFN